ncbi:hypothetical protein ACFFRR_003118 [Megaselia abdita]
MRPSENNVEFPKRVFRRGEYILIDIDIDENLGKKNRTMEFYLMQYINYKSKESCFYRLEKSKTSEIQNFSLKTEDFQYKQSFLVPSNIPSTFEFKEDILTVSYVLKVYVNGKKFKFPIVIGDRYQQ